MSKAKTFVAGFDGFLIEDLFEEAAKGNDKYVANYISGAITSKKNGDSSAFDAIMQNDFFNAFPEYKTVMQKASFFGLDKVYLNLLLGITYPAPSVPASNPSAPAIPKPFTPQPANRASVALTSSSSSLNQMTSRYNSSNNTSVSSSPVNTPVVTSSSPNLRYNQQYGYPVNYPVNTPAATISSPASNRLSTNFSALQQMVAKSQAASSAPRNMRIYVPPVGVGGNSAVAQSPNISSSSSSAAIAPNISQLKKSPKKNEFSEFDSLPDDADGKWRYLNEVLSAGPDDHRMAVIRAVGAFGNILGREAARMGVSHRQYVGHRDVPFTYIHDDLVSVKPAGDVGLILVTPKTNIQLEKTTERPAIFDSNAVTEIEETTKNNNRANTPKRRLIYKDTSAKRHDSINGLHGALKKSLNEEHNEISLEYERSRDVAVFFIRDERDYQQLFTLALNKELHALHGLKNIPIVKISKPRINGGRDRGPIILTRLQYLESSLSLIDSCYDYLVFLQNDIENSLEKILLSIAGGVADKNQLSHVVLGEDNKFHKQHENLIHSLVGGLKKKFITPEHRQMIDGVRIKVLQKINAKVEEKVSDVSIGRDVKHAAQVIQMSDKNNGSSPSAPMLRTETALYLVNNPQTKTNTKGWMSNGGRAPVNASSSITRNPLPIQLQNNVKIAKKGIPGIFGAKKTITVTTQLQQPAHLVNCIDHNTLAQKAGFDVDSLKAQASFMRAVESGNFTRVKVWLRLGMNPDFVKDGTTPLLAAIDNNHFAIVYKLLDFDFTNSQDTILSTILNQYFTVKAQVEMDGKDFAAKTLMKEYLYLLQELVKKGLTISDKAILQDDPHLNKSLAGAIRTSGRNSPTSSGVSSSGIVGTNTPQKISPPRSPVMATSPRPLPVIPSSQPSSSPQISQRSSVRASLPPLTNELGLAMSFRDNVTLDVFHTDPTSGVQRTHLMSFIELGDIAMVRALIFVGANLDAQHPNQNTALIRAIYNGQYDIAQMLLDAGANPNIAGRPYDGVAATPLGTAIANFDETRADNIQQRMLVESLLKKGAVVPTDKATSAKIKNNIILGNIVATANAPVASLSKEAAAVENLARAGGINLIPNDPNQQTYLMKYSDEGNIEMVRALLKKGANPNLKGRDDQNTALVRAIHNRHYDIANLLLDNGADVNLAGRTYNNVAAMPLRTAIMKYDGSLENHNLVERLINSRANLIRDDELNRQIREYRRLQALVGSYQTIGGNNVVPRR